MWHHQVRVVRSYRLGSCRGDCLGPWGGVCRPCQSQCTCTAVAPIGHSAGYTWCTVVQVNKYTCKCKCILHAYVININLFVKTSWIKINRVRGGPAAWVPGGAAVSAVCITSSASHPGCEQLQLVAGTCCGLRSSTDTCREPSTTPSTHGQARQMPLFPTRCRFETRAGLWLLLLLLLRSYPKVASLAGWGARVVN